jgi:adenylylsulfate kinase-like enzyme
MADAGLIVIVSLISPFRVDREAARQAIGADRFVEVFVDAPLEVCRARDPKGHYARVSAGEMLRFTGVASPYEPPMQPDVHVRTVSEAPDSCVQRILQIVDHRDVMLKDTLPPL